MNKEKKGRVAPQPRESRHVHYTLILPIYHVVCLAQSEQMP